MIDNLEFCKIAVIGEKNVVEGITAPNVECFDSISEINPDDYTFIIDSSCDNIHLKFCDNNETLIECSDKVFAIKQLVSLFVSKKYIDIDYLDLKTAMKSKCRFISYQGGIDNVLNIVSSLKSLENQTVIMYITGEFALEDIQNIVDSVHIEEVLYAASFDSDMNNEICVSLWCSS